MWEAYLLQFLWNLPKQNSFVSLFIEKLSVPHRFCFYAKILSLSFLLCFHRTSSGLTTIHFSFFSLSNKTLNLYEVSMYSAKVFHFSTIDDYWKIGKKYFEVISRKSLKRGLTWLMPLCPLILLLLSAPFMTTWLSGWKSATPLHTI